VQDRPNVETGRRGVVPRAGLWGSYGREVAPPSALLVHPSGFGSPGPRFKFGQPHLGSERRRVRPYRVVEVGGRRPDAARAGKRYGPEVGNRGRPPVAALGRPPTMVETSQTSPPASSSLGAALLLCENCGRETLHRILRLDRAPVSPAPRSLQGIARCRVCRWTHPFVSAREPRVTVEVIVSRGSESERRRLELHPSDLLRVGEQLPGVAPEVVVRRIDRRDGGRPGPTLAREAGTVWGVEAQPPLLRVAVQEGPRSTTERLPYRPGSRLAVGDLLRLPSGPVTIVALRARDRTWRRPGDAFPVEEVRVVYGRRSRRPPAGMSPWRRVRGIPSSRASSTSRDGRSRSSPGVRRNRSVPRARSAGGGATERSSSSS
jgi:uncharacterized Zn finger protein